MPDPVLPSLPARTRGFDAAGRLDSATFRLRRLRAATPGRGFVLTDSVETVLIAPDAAGILDRPGGQGQQDGPWELPRRAVAILPPGRWRLRAAGAGDFLLAAPAAHTPARNAPPWRRRGATGIPLVHAIDTLPTLPHNPRMRILQSAALSLNWTEYDGPRDRSRLSPHAHAEWAQGALALSGRFVHHLRAPWGPDAARWQPDRHLACGPGRFVEIPGGAIHTSEGVGPGHHLLIELFCPPRRDFRDRGWIANADAYVPAPDMAGGTATDPDHADG